LYCVDSNAIQVKLADFGFGGTLKGCYSDAGFLRRAKGFGILVDEKAIRAAVQFPSATSEDDDTQSSLAPLKNFAMAEDLHALGFVFLGLLLGSLAEPPTVSIDPTNKTASKRKKQDAIVPGFVMPDTSEMRLQAVSNSQKLNCVIALCPFFVVSTFLLLSPRYV